MADMNFSKENISQQELDERVAILKRLRSLLQQQRDKFKEYLTVLEKQETSIQEDKTEKILAHTELEQQVLTSISSLRKVIIPMEKMYELTHKKSAMNSKDTLEISQLQKELQSLQEKVIIQNDKNRELLKIQMNELKTKIQNFKNPYKNISSVYSSNSVTSSIIDVQV